MLKTYILQNPDSLKELQRRLETAIHRDNTFELTVCEQQDELSAQRHPAQPEKLRLKLLSIYFGPDGHIICKVIDRGMNGRIDFAAKPLTLTTVSTGGTTATP